MTPPLWFAARANKTKLRNFRRTKREEAGPLRTRLSMSARECRQSPSRGEQLLSPGWLNLGGCDNPTPAAHEHIASLSPHAQREARHASHATLAPTVGSMPAMRRRFAGFRIKNL